MSFILLFEDTRKSIIGDAYWGTSLDTTHITTPALIMMIFPPKKSDASFLPFGVHIAESIFLLNS